MLQRLLYSPFLVQMVVTRRCNLACGYCNEFDDSSEPVPTDELKRRIDKIAELGAWEFEITGGEPMLHPDIFELVRHAKSKRFRRLMLISNAYLLNEEKVRKLNEAGLSDLQISVDGVLPNSTTVKVLNPLRPKLEAVIRTAKFRVVLNAVVGSAPPAEALEVFSYAQEHGFVPRTCLIHGGDGQVQLDPGQLAAYREIQSRLGRGFREAGDYRTRLMQEGRAPFKCRAGSRYLYVDEFGIVRWCSQQREAFGVPLANYSFAEMRRQFYTRKTCNEQCTVGCARTCSSHENWRGQPLDSDASLAMPAVPPPKQTDSR